MRFRKTQAGGRDTEHCAGVTEREALQILVPLVAAVAEQLDVSVPLRDELETSVQMMRESLEDAEQCPPRLRLVPPHPVGE